MTSIKASEKHCRSIPQLTAVTGERRCSSRMSLSEVMTIAIRRSLPVKLGAFHGSGYRTFKEFYTLQVQPHWKKARQCGLRGNPHEQLS
ncbi:MAG: hypothetical protein QNJ41_23225 [Xenococcaceae cyanobacterium MO_188.B32]|nr:hypothetical protein [Xenococcaceae cyanobacterium MO_188.B32]